VSSVILDLGIVNKVEGFHLLDVSVLIDDVDVLEVDVFTDLIT
tara:strand:+ start:265 stop:393 length:129 start_codon:yes stop_codon:yes gene_type:complete